MLAPHGGNAVGWVERTCGAWLSHVIVAGTNALHADDSVVLYNEQKLLPPGLGAFSWACPRATGTTSCVAATVFLPRAGEEVAR